MNIELSDETIRVFTNSLSIVDIIEFVNNNRSDYELWTKENKKKSKDSLKDKEINNGETNSISTL